MPVPEDGIPGWDRMKLKAALNTCDSHALVAFYSHFRPILVERAQMFGIPHSARDDAVETFLGDMLLKLCSAADLPKSIHAYVFVSFRRYAFRIGQADRIETDALLEFATTADPAEKSVAEVQPRYGDGAGSDDARLVIVGQGDAEDHSHNAALSRFAAALLNGLTAEDKLILGARAEEMPLREVASLLRMNYNAANTRLCRLRSKLRLNAPGVASRMDPKDRPIVERFLRRAREGVGSALPRPDPPLSAKARQGGV
ncbi:MAG: hypothetical protein JWL97_15 [Gemmatimonadales bacterium]|jgi:DNA-directed RNA polymerase specialized sigma24 family protein|nr:hypothetical protein [Gemmatimonadales bacterium]